VTTLANTHLGDYASVASAVFAAIAAGAAWMSARHAGRAIEEAERPQLEAQVLADPETGLLSVAVVNTGRGVARGGIVLLHALGRYVEVPISDGFVSPGEKIYVKTDIGPVPTEDLKGDISDLGVMVSYRDAQGFAHYRAGTGAHYSPRRLVMRRPKYPDRWEAFGRLFPAIELSQGVARGVSTRQGQLARRCTLGACCASNHLSETPGAAP
jgi:hypothetical protein